MAKAKVSISFTVNFEITGLSNDMKLSELVADAKAKAEALAAKMAQEIGAKQEYGYPAASMSHVNSIVVTP